MIKEAAAKRYAEAAYLIASEDGKQAAWSEGLDAMASLFADPEAEAFLENSRVAPAEKVQLLERALGGVEPQVVNLARLLLRRGKSGLGAQIREAFQELVDQARGISHAIVTSAVPLTAGDVKAVTDRLSEITGGRVFVETRVDESILGGLVVRIGDRLIDGSTRSKLVALKKQLSGASA